MNLNNIGLEELERRKEVLEWQITIAKSNTLIKEKEIRLTHINKKISELAKFK